MKIINEKGKLFGIINVIDLLVIVLVLAIALVGVKFFMDGGFAAINKDKNDLFAGPATELEITFYGEEISDFVAEQLFVGAKLYDETSLEVLGEVKSFEIGPAESHVMTADGKYVVTTRDHYNSLKIVGVVDGQRTPLGATVGKTHYASGHTFVLRAGDAKLYLRVHSVRAAQKRLRRDIVDGSILAPEKAA